MTPDDEPTCKHGIGIFNFCRYCYKESCVHHNWVLEEAQNRCGCGECNACRYEDGRIYQEVCTDCGERRPAP